MSITAACCLQSLNISWMHLKLCSLVRMRFIQKYLSNFTVPTLASLRDYRGFRPTEDYVTLVQKSAMAFKAFELGLLRQH